MIDTKIKSFLEKAFEEDVGTGDFTTLAIVPPNKKIEANLLVKEKCIIAGVSIAKDIFEWLDSEANVEIFIKDGTFCDGNKNIALKVFANAVVVLKAERLVLNILQRMSGIATKTHRYVEAIKGTNAKILDTRKTTPGFRYFEKLAVKIGGGYNHRFGLFDQILIKDNHIDIAGGIDEALKKTYSYIKENSLNIPVEIEARNLNDVEKILKYDFVESILLDNFSIEETRKAVEIVNKRKKLESSGGINLTNIRDYALCGVDFISVGDLTHHIESIDMSLKIKV